MSDTSAYHQNLEEELIALRKPFDGLTSGKFTEEQKEEARARILARLKNQSGPIEADNWRDIRAELDLNDIHIVLFKKSCWHLRQGDRDPQGVPRIKVGRSDGGGHGLKRPIVISAM